MPDNARARISTDYATSSDFNRSMSRQFEMTDATVEHRIELSLSVPVASDALDLTSWTTVPWLAVYNKDPTNYLFVQYYTEFASQVVDTLGFSFVTAGPDTINDLDGGNFFLTNQAVPGNYVWATDPEDAGNAQPYLIDSATANAITLVSGDTVTANAADTAATLHFLRLNALKVDPLTWVMIQQPFVTGQLVLAANTAPCEAEVVGVAT